METTIIAYQQVSEDYGYSLRPLNPTGRWKLKTDAYETNKLYIEHKGLIFKSWVHENNIVFKPGEQEVVIGSNAKPVSSEGRVIFS